MSLRKALDQMQGIVTQLLEHGEPAAGTKEELATKEQFFILCGRVGKARMTRATRLDVLSECSTMYWACVLKAKELWLAHEIVRRMDELLSRLQADLP